MHSAEVASAVPDSARESHSLKYWVLFEHRIDRRIISIDLLTQHLSTPHPYDVPNILEQGEPFATFGTLRIWNPAARCIED